MAQNKKNEGLRNSPNGIAEKKQPFVRISENLNVMPVVRRRFVKVKVWVPAKCRCRDQGIVEESESLGARLISAIGSRFEDPLALL